MGPVKRQKKVLMELKHSHTEKLDGQTVCKNGKTNEIIHPSDMESESDISDNDEMLDKLLNVGPPICTIQIDCVQIFLFLLALVTRLRGISNPRAVVFDELHTIKFIESYFKNIFFFDTHPPFVKLLFMWLGYLFGCPSMESSEKVGVSYPESYPITALRLAPAIVNCLTVLVVYQIILSLKLSRWIASTASLCFILDNTLLTQSRVLMSEPFLVFFISLSVLATLQLLSHRPFSLSWWVWLFTLSVCIGICISIKYISIMTILFILIINAWDFWTRLGEKGSDLRKVLLEAIVKLVVIISMTASIYISLFYVHLSILTHAGRHDNIMTSRFQASLEGGLRSITMGQPPTIAYGSQITLRHTFGPACWLHSHKAVYPVKYSDGRGSSHQQQVTCYHHKDVNNWWLVKNPNKSELVIDDPIVPVKHGDIVELVHGMTKRQLNSHDVAAPNTREMQEVSGYIDYNVNMTSRTLWRVEILNKDTDGDVWTTIRSHVQLIHVNSSQILRISGKHLPDWGFNQLEVVTAKTPHDNAVWNVEEHKYSKPKDPKDTEPKDSDIRESELIPTKSTYLTFWEKFSELQLKMLQVPNRPFVHRFSSSPIDWLTGAGNVAYWRNGSSTTQIHLVGNISIWFTALVCILFQFVTIIFFILSRARCVCPYDDSDFEKVCFLCAFSVGGYLLHYLPFYMIESTYFLYHYVPALFFKLLIVPVTLEMMLVLCRHNVKAQLCQLLVVSVWLAVVTATFIKLLPICYGDEITKDDVRALQLHPKWDFFVN